MVKNLFLNTSPVVGSTIHTSLLAWPVTCVVSLCISTGRTARQCLKSKENVQWSLNRKFVFTKSFFFDW